MECGKNELNIYNCMTTEQLHLLMIMWYDWSQELNFINVD